MSPRVSRPTADKVTWEGTLVSEDTERLDDALTITDGAPLLRVGVRGELQAIQARTGAGHFPLTSHLALKLPSTAAPVVVPALVRVRVPLASAPRV